MGDSKSDVYVSFLICRDILKSKEGQPSIMGVTNQFSAAPLSATLTFPGESPTPFSLFQNIQLSSFVSVYTETDQEIELAIKLRAPNGKYIEPSEPNIRRLQLISGDKGLVIDMRSDFNPSVEGLFWFEVYVNGESKNMTPFRVRHLPPIQLTIPIPQPKNPSDLMADDDQN